MTIRGKLLMLFAVRELPLDIQEAIALPMEKMDTLQADEWAQKAVTIINESENSSEILQKVQTILTQK